MNDQPVRCARARMIIEFADGRAIYWEARDPQAAEIEHLKTDSLTWDELGALPADSVADWLHGGGLFPKQPKAALRITGGIPWGIRIEQDSGEIPPEVADRALRALDALAGERAGALWDLRPYLARIAGRQP